MTSDILKIKELKEKLERAEYIRKQQLVLIKKLQEKINKLEKELSDINDYISSEVM